jgi:hypothetical protein
VGVAFVYLQIPLSPALEKIREQSLPLSQLVEKVCLAVQDLPRNDGFARQAYSLMEKYSGEKKKLVYLFGEKGLDISLYTGCSEIYPYNDVTQAAISPKTVERIMKFNPHLKPGDYLYYSKDLLMIRGSLYPLEPMIFHQILSHYDLERVDSQGGIYVGRLKFKSHSVMQDR